MRYARIEPTVKRQPACPLTVPQIRQLAVTLRAAIGGKVKNSSGLVCSWPYINALRCWGQVLSQYSAKDELVRRPLARVVPAFLPCDHTALT
eukprot:SAG11_NODE_9944_length_867_cov_1.238281_3_plen_91_part_01